jgi:DMSO/TMAO reductase YedYZ molybdopterin-dependent catalytic subunit
MDADARVIRSPDIERKNRIPPGQRQTDRMPVLHHGRVEKVDIGKWKFNITGLVEKRVELTFEEFTSLPKTKVLSDIHCVTGWSMLNSTWEGVASREILRIANILPEAKFVLVHAAGGFTTNLTLEDFSQEDVIFALGQDGETTSPEHGYPVRLVVPRLYFWKSAKWVEGVEFMDKEELGFWETHGYHRRGDPWKEERYSGD